MQTQKVFWETRYFLLIDQILLKPQMLKQSQLWCSKKLLYEVKHEGHRYSELEYVDLAGTLQPQ